MRGASSTAYQPPSVASSFQGEAGADLAREKSAVGPDAAQDLLLQLRAHAEQRGRRPLHGSADGQVGVGDQFQAFESLLAVSETGRRSRSTRASIGAGAATLERPLRQNVRTSSTPVNERTRGAWSSNSVIRENFVGNERQVVLAAQRQERAKLGLLEERTGRIVRIHQHDGARAGVMERASASKSMAHRRGRPAGTGLRALNRARPDSRTKDTTGWEPAPRRRGRPAA